MARCVICDYTTDDAVQSSLFSESIHRHHINREPRWVKTTPHGVVCEECELSIQDSLKEFEEEEPTNDN